MATGNRLVAYRGSRYARSGVQNNTFAGLQERTDGTKRIDAAGLCCPRNWRGVGCERLATRLWGRDAGCRRPRRGDRAGGDLQRPIRRDDLVSTSGVYGAGGQDAARGDDVAVGQRVGLLRAGARVGLDGSRADLERAVPIPALGRRPAREGPAEGVWNVVPEFHAKTNTAPAIGHDVWATSPVEDGIRPFSARVVTASA